MIKASYSAEGDVLFIALGTRKPTGRQVSHEVAPHVTVDIDEAGRVTAIEFLCASEHFSDAELATVGSEPTWLSITEALADAATDGDVMEASTLRRLLIDGTILGKKDGPDWRVAWHSLANYLENRPKRGPKPRIHITAGPDSKWIEKEERDGSVRGASHRTQDGAIRAAREKLSHANGGELVVHGRDGRMRESSLVKGESRTGKAVKREGKSGQAKKKNPKKVPK